MGYDSYMAKRYVSLESQDYVVAPPPYRKPRRRHHFSGACGCIGGCICGCLKCLCCSFYSCCRCCICTLLIIVIIIVAIVIALYYFLKPNIPSYNIENFDIKNLELRKDNKIFSDIGVVVKADNPNENIGLSYLENEVSLLYSGSQICSGQMPPFLQPPKNVTNVHVALKGESKFGPEMQQRLMHDQDKGNIPLLITVKLPIRLVLDDFLHLRKFVVNVNCSLVIDGLQPNKKPKILRKDFTYGFDF